MRVYLAAPYAARPYVHDTGYAALESAGHECTSTWAQSTGEIDSQNLGPSPATDQADVISHVSRDLADIDRSDAVIQLTAEFCIQNAGCTADQQLHSGGRHVELGYALARDIPVIVVGPDENVFQRGFCLTAETLAEAIELLNTFA